MVTPTFFQRFDHKKEEAIAQKNDEYNVKCCKREVSVSNRRDVAEKFCNKKRSSPNTLQYFRVVPFYMYLWMMTTDHTGYRTPIRTVILFNGEVWSLSFRNFVFCDRHWGKQRMIVLSCHCALFNQNVDEIMDLNILSQFYQIGKLLWFSHRNWTVLYQTLR